MAECVPMTSFREVQTLIRPVAPSITNSLELSPVVVGATTELLIEKEYDPHICATLRAVDTESVTPVTVCGT